MQLRIMHMPQVKGTTPHTVHNSLYGKSMRLIHVSFGISIIFARMNHGAIMLNQNPKTQLKWLFMLSNS